MQTYNSIRVPRIRHTRNLHPPNPLLIDKRIRPVHMVEERIDQDTRVRNLHVRNSSTSSVTSRLNRFMPCNRHRNSSLLLLKLGDILRQLLHARLQRLVRAFPSGVDARRAVWQISAAFLLQPTAPVACWAGDSCSCRHSCSSYISNPWQWQWRRLRRGPLHAKAMGRKGGIR